MLIINDKKGWFGSFSEVGKRAAKMNLLISRDPLNLAKARQKFCNKGSLVISAFESSENKNKPIFKKGEDTFDIFTIDETDKAKLEELAKEGVPKSSSKYKQIQKKQNKKKNKKNTFRIQSALNNDNSRKRYYHYYDMHRKKKNKITPPCTKYNPKYTSIFKRSASTPAWSTMRGRDDIFVRKDDISEKKDDTLPRKDEHLFYIKHENILDTMAGKSFIDMKKQSRNKNSYIKISRPPSSYGSSSLTLKKNISAYNSYNRNIQANNVNNVNNKRPYSSINPRIRRKNYSINLRSNISAFSESKNNPNISKIEKKSKNKNVTNIQKNKTIDANINKSNNKLFNISGNKSNINENIEKNLSKFENEKQDEDEDEDEDEDISEDSYELYKHVYTKKIKNKNKRKNENEYQKETIKGPDLKKMLSREALEKLYDDKSPIVPYLLPNFSPIHGRHIMMVVYDRKKHKINRSKTASLGRIDNTFYYNPNDILTKINNYVSSHPPNFKLMTSRPDDDDPLPSYMKRIYSRNSCYDITQLSLKLNNYKNRGFTTMHSSFWPKKSYNKIVNLNLLKSKKFLNNVVGNQNNLLKQFKGLETSLKFYNKNYEDILRENFLERFDNVTYKSIKRDHSKQVIELVKKIQEEANH